MLIYFFKGLSPPAAPVAAPWCILPLPLPLPAPYLLTLPYGLGRLFRCGVRKKEGKSLLWTGFRSSSAQHDALDTTSSQDIIA